MTGNYNKNERSGNGNNSFTFQRYKTFAQIGERKDTGFAKEISYISFQGGQPKWDIREWDEKHQKMSRGVTFTDSEFADLCAACEKIVEELQASDFNITEVKRPEDSEKYLKLFQKARSENEAEKEDEEREKLRDEELPPFMTEEDTDEKSVEADMVFSKEAVN